MGLAVADQGGLAVADDGMGLAVADQGGLAVADDGKGAGCG
jgi:hypothetical protein